MLPGAREPDLDRFTAGAAAAVAIVDGLLGAVSSAPAGVVAEPTAVLRTEPASTSAWAMVYVAVAVTV